MQTVRQQKKRGWRLTGAAAVLLATEVFAQGTFAEPAGARSPLTTVMVAGTLVLFLLLAAFGFLAYFYRKRSLLLADKCGELEPELEKTQHDLSDVTAWADLHERLIDDSGAAVFRLNAAGKCIYVNSAMEKLTGYSKHWVLQFGLLEAVHPDDRDQVAEQWQDFATRHEPSHCAFRLLREDGRAVHVTGWGATLRDKKTHVVGYSGILMDETARVDECEEARRTERYCNAFVQQTDLGFYELRAEEPIYLDLPADDVIEQIQRRMKITMCSRHLANLYGKTAGELIGSSLSDLPGGCGIFENPDRIRQFIADEFKTFGVEVVRSDYRGTPVYLHNNAMGMVENGHLVSIWGTQRDISLQKSEAEQQERRVEFFQRILDSLPGDVFVKDARCRFLYVSRGFEERTGVPVEDWMDKTVFEVLPATSRDFNKTSIEVMKSGELCRTEAISAGTDRDEWIETLETPLVSEDGVVEGVVGLSVDMTERTRRERALQQEEARFRHLVEASPAGIILADAASKTVSYANPAFCDLFGYTTDDVCDLGIGDLHSPGSRKQVLAEWDERARNAQPFEEALPCLRKDRSVVFADVGVSEGRLDGRDVFVGIYSDAAGRKQIETELERQRDLQAGLLHNAAVLVARVDSAGVICSANDALLELLGCDEAALVGKLYVDRLVSEADRGILGGAFANCTPGHQADYTYRLTAAGGELRAVACRVRTWVDPSSGQADGFTVSGVDITEQRLLEEKLRGECDGLRGRLAEREDSLVELREAHHESEQLREALVDELRTVEERLVRREQQFVHDAAEHERRQGELSELIEQLKGSRDELEEALGARKKELDEESVRRRQLEELLEQTREQFETEKEARESEAREKIEGLEQEVSRLRDREDELSAEGESLKTKLSEVKEELRICMQELDSRSGEWTAREKELVAARDELQERAEQQAVKLDQAVELRSLLEEKLETYRKEVSAGRETLHVQVEQKTEPLKKQLNELQAREKELKGAHEEAVRRIAELEEKLQERTREFEDEAAARKEEEQKFLEAKRSLEDALVEEKNKLAEELQQFNEEKVKSRSEESALRTKLNGLQQKNEKLELLVDQRTSKLSRSADRLVALEARLAELQEEMDRERDGVQEQINQKTSELKAELEEQKKREEALREEQAALSGQLTEAQEALDERAKEIEELQQTRQDLEELIEKEKEQFAQRIELFKGEISEGQKAVDIWEQREGELLEKIGEFEGLLEKRAQELARETGGRQRAEEEVSRLQEAAKVDHQMVDDLTEDLCEPLSTVLELSESAQAAGGFAGEEQTQLGEINRCGRRLLAILNYRKELTHLDDGVIRIRPEPFELNQFLKDLTGEYTEKADARQIFFAFSHAGDLSGTVRSDQSKIRRILHSLLDHALQHSTAKGQMGLHILCGKSEEGGRQLAFQLVYSGLNQDASVTGGLLDASGEGISCREMGDEELRLDLARRYAQLLGGKLFLENRSEVQKMISLVLPVEYEPAAEEVLAEAEECSA